MTEQKPENARYNDALQKLESVIAEFEKQDKEFEEMYGFDPKLFSDFGVLYPEAVKNMLENRQMLRSESCDREWKTICKYRHNPE